MHIDQFLTGVPLQIRAYDPLLLVSGHAHALVSSTRAQESFLAVQVGAQEGDCQISDTLPALNHC
jgi:hypothetical protein